MTAQPLDYARSPERLPVRINRLKWAFRIAVTCGALPLVTGVTVFGLWLMTSWFWLVSAGIITLYAGLGLFVLGGVALGVYVHTAKTVSPHSNVRRRAIACFMLLLSNFPVAAVIVVTAIALWGRYTVVVHNTSKAALANVRVFGGGCSESFGSIPAGSSGRRSFYIQHDDELKFECVRSGVRVSETIDGYVTNSMGGRTTVTVGDGGPVSVQHQR